MKSSTVHQLLRTSLLALFVSRAAAQSATVPAGPIQTLNCYESSDPLTQNNTNRFQTDGLCQTACTGAGMPVMAITGGSTCYCGDELPAADQQVDSSKCNSPCQGFGDRTCGGIGYWQVYLTGLTGDVKTAPNSTSSSSSSSTSASATHPAETVVVTQTPVTSSSIASGSKGPSKIGIAVGVVVAIIIIAAAAGALVYFMKQKRRREIEEEHKQQAAITSFVHANKAADSKLATDQRLDPNVFSARRESVGSIADERDFSRRILQVRNPDNRGSLQSMA